MAKPEAFFRNDAVLINQPQQTSRLHRAATVADANDADFGLRIVVDPGASLSCKVAICVLDSIFPRVCKHAVPCTSHRPWLGSDASGVVCTYAAVWLVRFSQRLLEQRPDGGSRAKPRVVQILTRSIQEREVQILICSGVALENRHRKLLQLLPDILLHPEVICGRRTTTCAGINFAHGNTPFAQ